MDAVVDRFVVSRKHEKAIKAGDRQHAARRRRPDAGPGRRRARARREAERFYKGLCSATHHFVYGDIGPTTSCSTIRRARAARAAASASTS